MNDLGFNQIATLVTAIADQATGRKNIIPTDTGSFTAVAQTTLLTGYDNVINAISQVLTRTIFSIRPYTRKFSSLQVSSAQYGNHVRKLQAIDSEWEDDQRKPLEDGTSVDMFTINKPKVLQTNFYGQAVYQRHITIFKDQLDEAFRSPEDFGRFITMVLINISDQIEQAHEGLSRGCIANLIGGISLSGNDNQVYHLLSEYNTATGNNYTPITILEPTVYEAFTKWAYARISGISSRLTERTQIYHTNVTGKEISRHTPVVDQRVYLYAPELYQISAMVLTNTYHDNLLRLTSNETVNFWQSIDDPMSIDVKATYMQVSGELASADVKLENIFGLIMDREAAGYTVVNQWSQRTPMNAAGGYSNIYWHFTDRYWNDFTENAVLLLMD